MTKHKKISNQGNCTLLSLVGEMHMSVDKNIRLIIKKELIKG